MRNDVRHWNFVISREKKKGEFILKENWHYYFANQPLNNFFVLLLVIVYALSEMSSYQ